MNSSWSDYGYQYWVWSSHNEVTRTTRAGVWLAVADFLQRGREIDAISGEQYIDGMNINSDWWYIKHSRLIQPDEALLDFLAEFPTEIAEEYA